MLYTTNVEKVVKEVVAEKKEAKPKGKKWFHKNLLKWIIFNNNLKEYIFSVYKY